MSKCEALKCSHTFTNAVTGQQSRTCTIRGNHAEGDSDLMTSDVCEMSGMLWHTSPLTHTADEGAESNVRFVKCPGSSTRERN